MHQKNITLEEVEIQEGNNLYSYDAEIEVHYSIEECECDTDRGTKTWEEVNIDDMLLVSFYKFQEGDDAYGGNMWIQLLKADMPKESWEFLKQKVLDESSEFVFDH
tara:strand:+ start:60 stop:377 length:318 start_codon:yes stop_codon:yes gene_type:complete